VVLGELRRFLGGQKATLRWDGLPAHRSNKMKAWIAGQRHWLVVERLPAYAPELNPVEGLWSNLKGKGGELANLCSPNLAGVIGQARRASTGSARRRILPTRFCVAPACRSPDVNRHRGRFRSP
jgi:DDE superfamily endonuclease